MPRMIRFEHPGSLVHIMARGIDGRDLFLSDIDRTIFITHLKTGLNSTGYKCLAWCLMNNHYHLLLRTNEAPMSALMRPLNGTYARWFNKTYSRRGYLFQDRYKSILCQDQDYAKQLVRYIHLNPIRGGLVRSVNELIKYPWCGHSYLMGIHGAYGSDFQDRTECLRRFSKIESSATGEYLQFLKNAVEKDSLSNAGRLESNSETEIKGSHKGWPAVIGDHDFARKAMEKHAIGLKRKHRKADYSSVLNRIAEETCRLYSISLEELYQRGRCNNRSMARAQFCFRASTEARIPLSVIAEYLNINIAPVSILIKKAKTSLNRAPLK